MDNHDIIRTTGIKTPEIRPGIGTKIAAQPIRTNTLSRRSFIRLASLAALGLLNPWPATSPQAAGRWRDLLGDYVAAARSNIVIVDGRPALLSSRTYPGTYVRDALFWGPLALGDAALGFECYRWFAETQLESGQIRTAVPLHPDEAVRLPPQDDESTLLFVIASEWLRRAFYPIEEGRVTRAYAWIQAHVHDDTYLSPPGPFRYWADTVQPEVREAIAHNQGLLCLARRAMVSLGWGGVTVEHVAAAQERYGSFYNRRAGYLMLGKYSKFAAVQDVSVILPEFLSRYLYNEPLLADEMVVRHVDRIVGNAAVRFADGRLAGLKVLSSARGAFLSPEWFFAPSLNPRGNYQNGGHWPLYSIVALALAYSISHAGRYAQMIGQLVVNELATDHQSKEFIRLTPGAAGTFDPWRSNYTWNALIATACQWCGLA